MTRHTHVVKLLEMSVQQPHLQLSDLQVVDSYSKRSFRLMAMAVGSVPNVDQLDLPRLSQQHAQEQSSGFVLLGLIVLTNCIRPESKDTVAELQQRYAPYCVHSQHHHWWLPTSSVQVCNSWGC